MEFIFSKVNSLQVFSTRTLTISAYVSLTASDFSNDTNYIKCCSNGKNDNTWKRRKIYLTGQKALSQNAMILSEKELCNYVPLSLIGTFIRSIKAAAMVIKNQEIYIFCLSLFIVKRHDSSRYYAIMLFIYRWYINTKFEYRCNQAFREKNGKRNIRKQ